MKKEMISILPLSSEILNVVWWRMSCSNARFNYRINVAFSLNINIGTSEIFSRGSSGVRKEILRPCRNNPLRTRGKRLGYHDSSHNFCILVLNSMLGTWGKRLGYHCSSHDFFILVLNSNERNARMTMQELDIMGFIRFIAYAFQVENILVLGSRQVFHESIS